MYKEIKYIIPNSKLISHEAKNYGKIHSKDQSSKQT